MFRPLVVHLVEAEVRLFVRRRCISIGPQLFVKILDVLAQLLEFAIDLLFFRHLEMP